MRKATACGVIVMPAKAGIQRRASARQYFLALDPRLRGDDRVESVRSALWREPRAQAK